MRNTHSKNIFQRRALLLGAGKVGLLSLLFGRMYYLQIIEGEKYKLLAEDNRMNEYLLPAKRGRIIDRYGKIIVDNEPNYQLFLYPDRADQPDTILGQVVDHLQLSFEERAHIGAMFAKRRPFHPFLIKEQLTWEELALIEKDKYLFPGIEVEINHQRLYPYHEIIGHVTGYVAAPKKEDVDRNPLYRHPDFKVGKDGLEAIYDNILQGVAGKKIMEVNARGRILRELSKQDDIPGKDLHTSIDADLQSYIVKRLGEESGSVVVMDVMSGELIALVTHPSYDPTTFIDGLSHEEWNTLRNNPKGPLKNKAIGGQYAPGSTFKMVVALAALESGLVKPQDHVFCSGGMHFGNRRFHCWKNGGHGSVNLHDSIKYSCDVYYYQTALKIGVDRIAEMARKLGIGIKLGIDLPDEKKGVAPDQAWKVKTFGEPWYQGETLSIGIGQGYVLATPLQLAVMTARLVNGGYAVIPTLKKRELLSVTQFEKLSFKQEHLVLIQKAMNAVVNEGGTAARSRITEPGFEMAGKTGTAQVRRITLEDRAAGRHKNENIAWELRDHALFVAFAPINEPRYAISVVIEHGGGGSAVAAPIAKDIMLLLQQRIQDKGATPIPEMPESHVES